jgi:hypothetical protein
VSDLVDPKTGQPVKVDDPAAAEAALRAGTLELRADKPTVLVDPRTGQLVDTNHINVAKLLDSGYRLATTQEVVKEDERQKYGEGFGNEAAAFAESTVSGATMGLSDVAAGIVAPEYAKDIAKRREHNPIASMAGEATGVVGSALFTGGESLLAKGVGAIGAPARAVSNLGVKATEAVAGQLAKKAATTVAGKAAQAATAYAAGGAVEGALTGVAKEVSDAFLHDHELTAERVILGAGNGLLLGGGLNAALGATGSLLASGAEKVGQSYEKAKKLLSLGDDVDPNSIGTGAIDDVGDLFNRTPEQIEGAKKLDEILSSHEAAQQHLQSQAVNDQVLLKEIGLKNDREILDNLAPNTDVDAEVIRQFTEEATAQSKTLTQHWDDIQQAATRKLVQNSNEIARVEKRVGAYINPSKKSKAVREMLDISEPTWTQGTANKILGRTTEIKNDLLKMRADPAKYTQNEIKALDAAIEAATSYETHLTGLAKGQVGPISPTSRVLRTDKDAIADVFIAGDTFKKRLGKIQNIAGKGEDQVTAAEAAIQRYYMSMRADLEDSTIFGDALANFQRITNAAESEAILKNRAMAQRFELKDALQNERAGAEGFDTLPALNSDSVGGFFNKANRAENSEAEAALALGQHRAIDLMETKAGFYKMPPELQAEIQRARELGQENLAVLQRAKAIKSHVDGYRAPVEAVEAAANPITEAAWEAGGALVGTAVGGFAGGYVGQQIAHVARQAVKSPQGRALIKKALGGEESIRAAAKGVLDWTKKTGRKTADVVVRSTPILGVQFSERDPEAYDKITNRIAQLQDPNSDARRVQRAGLFEVKQEHPQLATALEAHTQRVAEFLASKAGPVSKSAKPGDLFGGLKKARHSPEQAMKLARYADAALHPNNALKRIAKGQIRKEDVETLKALYPRTYQRVVSEILTDIGTVEKLPDYKTRVKLSHLLGVPVDPSMTAERVQALQQVALSNAAVKAQEQENGGPVGGSARPPKLDTIYATRPMEVASTKY